MRVLVTGSAGFIGQHLCRELREAGHYVLGVDRAAVTIDDATFRCDLLDPENVNHVLQRNLNVVIHLAAKVGRLFGEDDVQFTVADNAGMTALIAQACGERGIRLMYASTSEVYGDTGAGLALDGTLNVHEDNRIRPASLPHNLYGLSKRWGEEVCQLYAPTDLTLMRLSMPYGPGLPAGKGRAAIINFLYNALHLQPIPVHKGSERSWCWVGDTVRAIRMLLEDDHTGAFNIGRDDDPRSMREVAELACDLTGAPYDLIEEIDPPGRQTVVKRLSTYGVRSLGWQPEVGLEEGMGRVLEWIREKYPTPVAA